MKKQFSLLVIIAVIIALFAGVAFLSRQKDGFQDDAPATDPTLAQMQQPDTQMQQPDMQMQQPDMQMQQPDMQMQQPDMQMQQPDTQLPPVQMPASLMKTGYTRPSLDECKKHYTCGISTTMN
jgi:hypothetical protein